MSPVPQHRSAVGRGELRLWHAGASVSERTIPRAVVSDDASMVVEDSGAASEWPLRYTKDQLAALRWLLSSPGAVDVPSGRSPRESRELASSIALGLHELEDAGMVTIDSASSVVTIASPHATVFAACHSGEIRVTMRTVVGARREVHVFVVSSIFDDDPVGLELWLRHDGSTWINTWPLEEMIVRLVERLDLPRVGASRAPRPPVLVPVDRIRHELLTINADPLAESGSPLSALLDRATSYVSLDVITRFDDDTIGGGELRILQVDDGILVAEVDADDLDTMVLLPTTQADLIDQLHDLMGGE